MQKDLMDVHSMPVLTLSFISPTLFRELSKEYPQYVHKMKSRKIVLTGSKAKFLVEHYFNLQLVNLSGNNITKGFHEHDQNDNFWATLRENRCIKGNSLEFYFCCTWLSFCGGVKFENFQHRFSRPRCCF